ncbi:MAG: 1-acyl-sn-glycerol-3-phosphate acyltransferase [Chromatiaceae bacterium]|nr:MAG: 1-acyl-sn-glycerol-3-phosphate acyltransferase [Chromatiaceae bacterium]
MSLPRAIWRSARISEHLLTGTLITALVALLRRLGLACRWYPRATRWWHGRLCRALGLRIAVHGQYQPGTLLVANHVSWLDIPVLGAQGQLAFLSKAEIRTWPLVGWLASMSGTLFIERGAHQAGDLAARIAARVGSGSSVLVFPEGTTSDGQALRRFHPRLFAAAQQPGIRVQPVAVRYGSNQAPDSIAPFVGDDNLLTHLPRILRHPHLAVEVHFLPPLVPGHRDRRTLAAQTQAAIAVALGEPAAAPPPHHEATAG